jgi:hypothetical protein
MFRMSPSFPHFAELLQRAKSYAVANWKHVRGGCRVTHPEELQRRLEICHRCPTEQFDGAGCRRCGCAVNNSESALRNKLAMATEACPDGHWGADEGLPTTPKLTVGMAMWRDFDGVYFTVRALEMYHRELAGQFEILVVDNKPEFSLDPANREPQVSGETASERVRNLMAQLPGGRYEMYMDRQGTAAPRDAVFRLARGEIVLCIDSHVLLAGGSLARTVEWFDDHPDFHGLVQGPLSYDNGQISTHQDPVWGAGMLGTWGLDSRYSGPDGNPFDIPLQGLGLFGCRRADWLGFNRHFAEFGAEEGYIHDKYRQAGHEVLCLPWLEWGHRFAAVGQHAHYPSSMRQRIKNYLHGRLELGQDVDDVVQHFYGPPPHGLGRPRDELQVLMNEVWNELTPEEQTRAAANAQ